MAKAGYVRPPARNVVKKRASGNCELCGTVFNRNKNKSNASIHHRLPQRMRGYHTVENMLHLCRDCHRGIHMDEEAAAAKGLIAWTAPEMTPVFLKERWLYLTEDGDYEFIREEEAKESIEYLLTFAPESRENSDPLLQDPAA